MQAILEVLGLPVAFLAQCGFSSRGDLYDTDSALTFLIWSLVCFFPSHLLLWAEPPSPVMHEGLIFALQ